MRLHEYQNEYCDFFNVIEKKNSNLLTHLKVYVGQHQLSMTKNTQDKIGNMLELIILNEKYQNIFLSKDSLAFGVLSKVNFSFITRQIPQLQLKDLEGQANEHINNLAKQFIQTNNFMDTQTNVAKKYKAFDPLFDDP